MITLDGTLVQPHISTTAKRSEIACVTSIIKAGENDIRVSMECKLRRTRIHYTGIAGA